MVALAAAVTAFFAFASPPTTGLGARVLACAVPAVLVGAVVALRRGDERIVQWLWLPLPFAGIAAIVALDLVTHDPSAGGQVFFCYPVLYAASLLRARVAYACLAVSVVAEAVVTLTLEPLHAALTDLGYVGATLATVTLLVVHATDRQQDLVQALQRQAALDPLTGLVTRRVLDDAAQAALAVGEARGGTALLLLDIDNFKTVNDTHGHPAGDQALQHVARVLGRVSRPDTVISRIGGDEIAVLLPGCPAEVARTRAHQMIDAVRANPLTLPDGTLLALSVSLGVGYVARGLGLRELYASADRSLYGAKHAGRNRVGPVRIAT
jgi:diguanylate cyclase (GGDEF)-like protein